MAEARSRLRDPVYYGCMMLACDDADALVAGEDMYYPQTIRPAFETIGVAGEGDAEWKRKARCHGLGLLKCGQNKRARSDCVHKVLSNNPRDRSRCRWDS